MCHAPQFEYARVEKDSFDFNPVYRNVKKYLESSDFTFGNLETVTAGKAVSYTHLRAHETVLDLVCRLLLETKKQHTNIEHSHDKNS